MDKKQYSLQEYVLLLKDNGFVVKTHDCGGIFNKTVRYISCDSSDIESGALFVCKGVHFSKEYLKDALAKGAFAYVSETVYELDGADTPYIIVNDVRKVMTFIAGLYYNNVWDQLQLVGLTGTKGKSTTAYYLKFIFDDYLKSRGKPESAILSSIDNYDGVINEESHITTPESFALYKHFNNAVESGIEYLSMEVSSQGLKYDRTLGVTFSVGCFLNIGEDHISGIEHTDFEDYFSSKLKFFKQCRTACVNLGSDHIDRIMETAKADAGEVITFGLTEKAGVYGYDIKPEQDGVTFKARTDSFDEKFELTMRGLFNVENALAAIAACYALGVPVCHMTGGLKKARSSGRMEVFRSASRGFDVIVDYAHNKMSFEALYSSIQREYPGKKIFVVFGCPGYKALGRRRELGEIAGKFSEMIFLTEEDAGEEPVINICEDIAEHVKKQNRNYEIIEDREKAIEKAIDTADENTVILITGKGRETRQKRGLEYVETRSDVDCVEEFLKI